MHTDNIKLELNTLSDVYIPIADELFKVEEKLEDVIRHIKSGYSSFRYLNEISDYFFRIPGKKMRPALVMLSAAAANGGKTTGSEFENNVLFAAAIELIHSASLIHDDIIDGDMTRRGQLTLNKKFGKQTAVLFGDMLYSEAFTLLTELKLEDALLKNQIIKTMCNISQQMCVGEIEEIRYANNYNIKEYEMVVEKKTALLMAVSCKCPVMLLGKTGITEKSLEEYGYYLGLLYQIVDDYLDNNVNIKDVNFSEYIDHVSGKALEAISGIVISVYSQKLIQFVECIRYKSKKEK